MAMSGSEVPSENGSEHEESEGENLFGDAFLDDYQANPELDYYETDDLVEDVTENLNAEEVVAARRRAEEEMDARDRIQFRRDETGAHAPS